MAFGNSRGLVKSSFSADSSTNFWYDSLKSTTSDSLSSDESRLASRWAANWAAREFGNAV